MINAINHYLYIKDNIPLAMKTEIRYVKSVTAK